MTEAQLVDGIVEALATVLAMPVPDLTAKIQADGMDQIMLKSDVVVAVLVILKPLTGIDPTDRNVLKGCNLQSLQQLVTLVAAGPSVTA